MSPPLSELAVVCHEAEVLRARGVPFLLATVVRVSGSAYRRPGARMLVAEDRWVAGSLSGGCLERDVLVRGGFRTRAGAARLVIYDASADDEVRAGLGLGCDGVVEVLLERIDAHTPLDPLAFAGACIAGECFGAVVTAFASCDPEVTVGSRMLVTSEGVVGTTLRRGVLVDALAAEARAVLAVERAVARVATVSGPGGDVTVLVERVGPPPHLFVVGTRHDAEHVVALARQVGFAVSLASTRHEPGVLAGAAFVGSPEAIAAKVDARLLSAAVIMTHDYAADRACLAALLGSRARYVGVLGPRARTTRMLEELGRTLSPEERARVHAPVGLDLGAETPREVALAIVAEVQASLACASGVRLRDLEGPVHRAMQAPRRPLGSAAP